MFGGTSSPSLQPTAFRRWLLSDDHTEYFRANLEALAPKERRVYTAVIDLWQASTAKEIAQRTRMDIRPVSALLGRLVNRGAISIEPGEGKAKYYAASERLYSIYYKLRRERNEASVVHGLIRFMLVFFNENELNDFVPNLLRDAKDVSEVKQGLKMVLQQDDLDSGKLIGFISFQDYIGLMDAPDNFSRWAESRMKKTVELTNTKDYTKALSCVDTMITELEKSDFNKLLIKVATLHPLFMKIFIFRSLHRVSEIKPVYLKIVSIHNMIPYDEAKAISLPWIQRACVLATLFTREAACLVEWYKLEDMANDSALAIFQSMVIVLYSMINDKEVLLEELERDENKAQKIKPLIVAIRQRVERSVRAPKEILEVAKDVNVKLDKFDAIGEMAFNLLKLENSSVDVFVYLLLLKACSISSDGVFFPELEVNKDFCQKLDETPKSFSANNDRSYSYDI